MRDDGFANARSEVVRAVGRAEIFDLDPVIGHLDANVFGGDGRVGQPHQHPGFLFVYVLEGAVVAQVLGDGVSAEERTYRAGEMFYEPIGSTHQVSKNASQTQPASLLVIRFERKEAD